MDEHSKKLLSELENFLSDYFKKRKYFVCVYGSFANGNRNKYSDVDVLVATNKYTNEDLSTIKKFILDLHKEKGLKIDNEVPFENKLIINYKDFDNAVNLKSFRLKNGKFSVPEIVKTKKFLGSNNIKLRLALNAITSPHFFLGNDKKTYWKYRYVGEKNIFALALYLSKNLSKITNPTKDNLTKILLGNDGRTGEMYLGYKNYPLVIEHLKSFISKFLIS